MAKHIVPGVIMIVVVFSIAITTKYGVEYQERRNEVRFRQYMTLWDAATRAEQRACEDRSLAMQLPRNKLQHAYVADFWPGEVRFMCVGEDRWGDLLRYSATWPSCNSVAVRNQWEEAGRFYDPLLTACGVEIR